MKITTLLLTISFVVSGCTQITTVKRESESTPKTEQDVTIVNGTVWKTSPGGLVMGIAHASDLTFNVQFRNQGSSDITGLIQRPARFILELNGKYYAMADRGGKTSYMPPGRRYGPLKIDTSRFWEIPELKQNYTVSPNASRPTLKGGTNTIRLHYKMENKLIPSGKLPVVK